MKRLLLCIFLLATTGFTRSALADPAEHAVKMSQQWQFALARSVKELVKQGQTDRKLIAKLVVEKTKSEEKKVREASKAMGVSDKKLDRSIERDRNESIDSYIHASLNQNRRASNPLKEEKGLLVFLHDQQVVEKHPKLALTRGFAFSTPKDSRPLLALPVAQSTDELISVFRKQPKSVQENGIWLNIPHWDISAKDKHLLEDLKHACHREGIPLLMETELEMSYKRIN